MSVFAKTCWDRAAKGVSEDEREMLAGPILDAEVYSACDLTRLSFTYKDGGKLKLDPAALSALESRFGLEREVRTPPDETGDFNFILKKGGTYVARVTPEKLFCEPKAAGFELGSALVAMYEGARA